MRFTTLKGEKSVNALVTRLFGDLPDDQRTIARQSLMRANPQLEAMNTLAAGAVLVVPDVAAAPELGVVREDAPPAAAFVREIADALTEFRGVLRDAARAEAEDAAQTGPILKGKNMTALIRAIPELGEHADRVMQASKQRTAGAKALQEFAGAGLDELEKDLNELAKRLS